MERIETIDLDMLANRQLDDYKKVNPGTCFGDPEFELGIDVAYRLQDAVTGLRLKEGDGVAGYKIGCIGSDIKSQFGMSGPIRGTIFKSEILSNGQELSAQSYCNLAIEAEMAFTVGDNGQIQDVFPVIELHNLIFRGPKKTLAELIANNGINAGVIMPDREMRNLNELDRAAEISLKINNLTFTTTEIWPIKNTPHGSLEWLETNLISHDLKVCSGNLVLAGTTLGLYPVQTGDVITVSLNGHALVMCSVK